MIFPLVPLILHFGAKPNKKCDVLCWVLTPARRAHALYNAHTDKRPLNTCMQMVSFYCSVQLNSRRAAGKFAKTTYQE